MTTDETMEVELKLELSPEAAHVFEAASLFGVDAVIVNQSATYFDTPDHDLSKAGISLRVRLNDDRRVQTIKTNGGRAAGMFRRPEWEREVEGELPIVDDTTPIPKAIGGKASLIGKMFTIDNERHIWHNSGIEIALDRGCIHAGDRTMSICELELEQKGGGAPALFALARRINDIVPVYPGALSKAQRGYHLLEPTLAAPTVGPVKLDVTMSAASAFQEIARDCLRDLLLNIPLIRTCQDAEALHWARVAIRRLRSALSIYKPMFGDGRAGYLNRELRWLAGEMGQARDLDVQIERLVGGSAHDRLLSLRAEAYVNAIAALESARARGLMIDIIEWIAVGDWLSNPDHHAIRTLPVCKFATKALNRFRRKLKKGGRNLKNLDDARRHEVRKTAKKLSYATDFFGELYMHDRQRQRRKIFAGDLDIILDKLGALNDLVVAPKIVSSLGSVADPDEKILLAGDSREDLLDDAIKAYDALVHAQRFWR